MKQHSILGLAALLAGSAALAYADTSIGVSIRSGEKPRSSVHYHSHSIPSHPHAAYVYRPYRSAPNHHRDHAHRPHYVRHHQPVYVVSPVVVPAPVYVQPESPVNNYGNEFAEFRERLSRLRAVAEAQQKSGQLEQSEYDRFMQELDGIEREQRERSFNRGGNLSSGDFADLYRRLDQIDEDIEVALAS
jgi:hypothetical protein